MDCMRALCAVTTMTFEVCRFGQLENLCGGGAELVIDALDWIAHLAGPQTGCWYRPITFPPGSRNRAVISGASAPRGWTISPPWATTASTAAATLSTMM